MSGQVEVVGIWLYIIHNLGMIRKIFFYRRWPWKVRLLGDWLRCLELCSLDALGPYSNAALGLEDNQSVALGEGTLAGQDATDACSHYGHLPLHLYLRGVSICFPSCAESHEIRANNVQCNYAYWNFWADVVYNFLDCGPAHWKKPLKSN